VIGGVRQTGKWKLDARYNKADLINRISRIARYSHRIAIYNLDAADFILKMVQSLPKKALFYLDPPYYMKGQDLYENHYSHDDHVRLASLLSERVHRPWIVSYDAVSQITEMYRQYRGIRYGLSYSAQNRYSGSEVMFFSHDFTVPRVSHPAKVDKKLLWH
jgi:DNA adenine methylase